MKTLRYLAAPALLAAALLFQSSAALPLYTEAVPKAAETKRYMIVIWNGSDWSAQGREVARGVETLSKAQNVPAIWCEWDEREKITKEEKESNFFNKNKPPAVVWNIPAIVVLTPDNKLVYKIEGVKPAQLKAILERIPAMIEKQNKAEQFWKQAEAAQGEQAAMLYGQGLALLPDYAAKDRKDILDKVKKADPDDKAGVLFRTNFHHQPYMEQVNKMADEKKYDEAEKLVTDKLAVKGLTKQQIQQLMAARFSLAKRKDDQPEMLKQLEAIAKIDPKSELGRGAANYYAYLTKPVMMKGNKFGEAEMRPYFLPIVMDASPYVKSPGKYKIECRFKRGNCDFRNPRFMSGSRVIADTPADIKDKNSREFTIDIPSSPGKLQLVLDIRGHGWFDAMGEIIITKM